MLIRQIICQLKTQPLTIIIMVLANGFLGLVAALLFLGSSVEFNELYEQLPYSFFAGFFPIWIVGIAFNTVLIALNWVISKLKIIEFTSAQIKSIILFSLFITTLCCAIGTAVFYFY